MQGVKPAYFCDHDDQDIHVHLRKLDYPSVKIVKGATLFFASEDLKNQFLIHLDGAEPYTRQYYIAVGLALGYPPAATKFFAEYMQNRGLEKVAAVFEYAGRYFGGRIDDKEQIAEWLWKNVPVPPGKVKVMPASGEEYYIFPDL